MEKEPVEEIPHIVEITPELELAWRGLAISVKEGQVSRDKAVQMLREWKGETVIIEREDE